MHTHHKKTIQRFANEIKNDGRFLALIITGSVARDNARPDSDVDGILISTNNSYYDFIRNNHLYYDASHLANYPNGQANAKIVSQSFIEELIERGNEPARYEFNKTILSFNMIPNLAQQLLKIPSYPEDSRLRKMESFYAQLPIHLSDLELAEYTENSYLITETAVKLVHFGARLLLAHNRRLYPNRKWLMKELEQLPEKPEEIIHLANQLLSTPSIKNGRAFFKAIDSFYPWPQPPEGVHARFLRDSELHWQRGLTPIADW